MGHPIITREALEEIGEFAFTTLRGLNIIGGQVRIDPNLLPDMMSAMDSAAAASTSANPTEQILDLIKHAALAFLEVESAIKEKSAGGQGDGGEKDGKKDGEETFDVDRSSLDLDFTLNHKSYALTVNALSMLAAHRPTYFHDAARSLALRAMDPPKPPPEDEPSSDPSALSKAGAMAIHSQLKASCLTLLRNTLSVTAGGCDILHRALKACGMEIQADKALKVAQQQAALRKAGRAARNRAAIFYEWEAAPDERSSKRQRQTDALSQLREARAARGLGGGIQLPANMVDACDLAILNLENLPDQRPASSAPSSEKNFPVDLESFLDAVMSNGASLSPDEGKWYARDGGSAWSMKFDEDEAGADRDAMCFALTDRAFQAAEVIVSGAAPESDDARAFDQQRGEAASDAFSRLVLSTSSARSKHLTNFGNQLAAKLAWTLRGIQPSGDLKDAQTLAAKSIEALKERGDPVKDGSSARKNADTMESLAGEYPLVPCCLAMDMIPTSQAADEPTVGTASVASTSSCLANRVLNEAYLHSCRAGDIANISDGSQRDEYDAALDMYVSSVVNACENANDKPNDTHKKRAATVAATSMPQQLAVLPDLTASALEITSSLCDINDITKKAAEASKKSSDKTLAATASIHAAKVAAEKRATQALLTLRDAAYQRSKPQMRSSAVDCAVAIAAGRLPASHIIEDKALKLVMNVLYQKNADIADCVVTSAINELDWAAKYAIDNYDRIQQANEETKTSDEADENVALIKPLSDVEKDALEKIRKAVVLFMALAVRKPEIIKDLLKIGSRKNANILAKAIRSNMPKLAKAAATKHGAAHVALQVSGGVGDSETELFLWFLNSMVQRTEKTPPSQDFVDACHTIQEDKRKESAEKDPQYIVPALSGITRGDLNTKLPELVAADNDTFKKALKRMSERLMRHALVFRDEPDIENPLRGMTLCEQVVYLHQLDFNAVGLPQKRYLDAIRMCLDDDVVFTDRVIMAALDYISGIFLAGESKLPLAYMRTIILTCSKHESLHSWICHVLLPRLVEGKVYEDRRQWEGWMRCAKMLENGESGISSLGAIEQLPATQLQQYRAKNPKAS